MSDILAQICADKAEQVAAAKAAAPLAEVTAKARDQAPPRGFMAALLATAADGRWALIAEIKKASPSGGLIRPDFDPPALARAYQAAGASCLSVLTDTPYFQGEAAHLGAARAAVPLPVLRKDFIIDPWQVAETRAMGADCLLVIMAALDDSTVRALFDAAAEFDLDVLTEVHDAAELDRALALDAAVIGINNRNLKTLVTDLAVTEELSARVPADRLMVSESGLRTPADLARMEAAGAGAFLIGESLMRQDDVEAATRALLTRPATAAAD